MVPGLMQQRSRVKIYTVASCWDKEIAQYESTDEADLKAGHVCLAISLFSSMHPFCAFKESFFNLRKN